ncbi:MAG TPA: hypothetical protein VN457_02365 [Chlamydiales bacterium]|nr:hypothetical protein [Chlamydiales bacterium]
MSLEFDDLSQRYPDTRTPFPPAMPDASLKAITPKATTPKTTKPKDTAKSAPSQIAKEAIAAPQGLIPARSVKATQLRGEALIKSRTEILHQIAALKEAYCAAVSKFGPLTETQKKELLVLQALAAFEKQLETSFQQADSKPLQISSPFSEKIQQFFVREMCADLIDRQMQIVLQEIDKVNKEKEKDDFPEEDKKELLAALKRQCIQLIEARETTPYDAVKTLDEEAERLCHEVQVFKSYLHRAEPEDYLPPNETLGGICDGTVTNFMRLKLMGAPSESWMMWPSAEARFLQVAYADNRLHRGQDKELARELHTLAADFSKQKKAYKKVPLVENFEKCILSHSKYIQLATRRLGLYPHREELIQKASVQYQQARIGTAADREKLLDSLETEMKAYKKQMHEWHTKNKEADTADVRILSHHGICLEELFDEYVDPADVPARLVVLKKKVEGSDGHVNLGVCTYSVGEEKNKFFEKDALSLAFYDTIQTLAEELKIPRLNIKKRADKEGALIEAINWTHEYGSKEDRKKLCVLFTEKHRGPLVQVAIERIVGKNAPEAVVKELTRKLNKGLDEKLKLLQRSPAHKRKSDENDHAVYVKLSPPYELRDPNAPDFSGFTTNDFSEFLVYLSFWMISENYTHFRDAYVATATTALQTEKIAHKEKLETQIKAGKEKAVALQAKAIAKIQAEIAENEARL